MKRHSLFAASLSAVLLAYAGQAAAEAESILSQVQRQQEELERYYASLKPVLTADTVLAGIAMPKGTTLTLPNRDRLSTELWTQHKYFLGADFSRPVVWQGVPIASIDRELSFPEVFVNAPPPQSPPTWGATVRAKLAAPQTVNGFDCQAGDIEWLHPATKRADSREVSNTDAAQAAPAYRLYSCRSAGQSFHDRQQAIEMKLPANSSIFQTRITGPFYPGSFLDV